MDGSSGTALMEIPYIDMERVSADAGPVRYKYRLFYIYHNFCFVSCILCCLRVLSGGAQPNHRGYRTFCSITHV